MANETRNFEEAYTGKREHTDPELLEVEAKGDDNELRKIVEETLSKSPLFGELTEDEQKEAIERDMKYLKDENKRGNKTE